MKVIGIEWETIWLRFKLSEKTTAVLGLKDSSHGETFVLERGNEGATDEFHLNVTTVGNGLFLPNCVYTLIDMDTFEPIDFSEDVKNNLIYLGKKFPYNGIKNAYAVNFEQNLSGDVVLKSSFYKRGGKAQGFLYERHLQAFFPGKSIEELTNVTTVIDVEWTSTDLVLTIENPRGYRVFLKSKDSKQLVDISCLMSNRDGIIDTYNLGINDFLTGLLNQNANFLLGTFIGNLPATSSVYAKTNDVLFTEAILTESAADKFAKMDLIFEKTRIIEVPRKEEIDDQSEEISDNSEMSQTSEGNADTDQAQDIEENGNSEESESISRDVEIKELTYTHMVSLVVKSPDDQQMNMKLVTARFVENSSPATMKLGKQRKLINRVYKYIRSIIPKRGKNILLLSETGDKLIGNLAAFEKELYERGIDKKFNIKVSAREQIGKSKSKMNWLQVMYKIAWADYIFIDNFVPMFSYLNLNSHTKVIQLWHAGLGFKSVGYSRFGKPAGPVPFGHAHRKYDYALAPTPDLIEVFEEVFGITKDKFLPYGMPRLKGYLNQDKIETFKSTFYQEHPELKDKKIILFGPTYRGAGQASAFYDFSQINFDELSKFLGDDHVFVLMMHPFTKTTREFYEAKKDFEANHEKYLRRVMPDFGEYNGRVIDFTGQYDINDMFYVADVFITDYSSAYYDYTLLEKPLLFFTYDRVLYETTRGVHRSVKDTAPGTVCDNFDQLLEALKTENYEFEKTLDFRKRYLPENIDNASSRVIDTILLKGK